nr:hypothetical protein GCM10020063_025150 [Dactylosporangium thailandense]
MVGGSLIDEIVREDARRMLAAALEAEVAAYIAAHREEVDEQGRRLVVRNGRARPRRVLTSAGAVEVTAPCVNDKRVDESTGDRRRFASAILPAWCRKSPKITEVLALLYLHGLSSQDFVPVLESFLGTGSGLSAPTISRLTVAWQDEARRFAGRSLSDVDYVYVWADGVHLNIRLDEEKLCLLVMIGVRVDGTKELVALAEGYRKSTFATVRHRPKVTKGPGSKAAGLAMAFKPIEAAQARWRAVNAPHLVALARAGARFERGKLVERPQPDTTQGAAA